MVATSPGGRGPYAKGLARRQAILDRALEVFAQVGFRDTSLRVVAEGIGVTHAAVRHYFTSVDDLLLAVLARADERALADFDVSSVQAAGEFSTKLATVSSGVPGLTALYVTMTARAIDAPESQMRGFFIQRYDQVRHFALLVLQAGRARGKVREDIDLQVAAALLIAACDGLTTQWLVDPTHDMHPALDLLDQLLRPTLMAGEVSATG